MAETISPQTIVDIILTQSGASVRYTDAGGETRSDYVIGTGEEESLMLQYDTKDDEGKESQKVARTSDYWISQHAIRITLNALGEPNRIQCSVASGAAVLCYIRSVKPASEGADYAKNGDGLGYDNGHNYRRWPLTISPTYFNTNSEKYVYVAIPRSASIDDTARIVFPSQKLDIYGYVLKEDGEQGEKIGSDDYFYIFLQGIISSSGSSGTTERKWTQDVNTGSLSTDEALNSREEDWYSYSSVDQTVTFLKEILMGEGSSFINLILNNKELIDVATSILETPVDSDKMVATPNYVDKFYLSKIKDDIAKGHITFEQGLTFDKILKSLGAREGFTDGRGIWMDALQGLIQTDGLEVRGFMRVMELIINRLQLMESDYSFTEGAEVEHIDYVDGGQRLRLWIHKEHDNDYAPFYEGDILYMKVNNLLPRGAAVPDGHTSTKNGSYYTVWMWVDEVDYTDNTITVSLYQSRQSTGAPIVPAGRNFTPYGSPIIDQAYPAEVLMEEMNIGADVASANNVVLAVTGDTLGEAGFDTNLTLTRHGNTGASSDPQIHRSQLGRQQSWVLSTTDQRLSFYWHVDAPIIRDDNYALCLGMLPDLANLPSTRNPEMPSLYINTIFYEFSHHIHYPSRIVKEDRGEWVQPDAAGVPPQPYATYTGDSGSWTTDGTLTWENIQDDIAEGRIPANRAKRETIDFLLSLAGTYDDEGHLIAPYTYTTGQDVFEPYHFESITAVQWISQRLSSSNDRWTDRELYLKVIIEWHLDLETSRVWYMGSLWECLKEGSATTPWYDNAEWLLIRGSDIRLTLMITKRFLRQSDFSGNRVATTMAFQLTMADNDVTSNVAADHVEWTRQTVGADEDTDESRALKSMDEWWNTYRGYHKLTIPVSSSDLPSNFWTVREVQFTCTVYLDGMESPQQRSLVLH